MASKDELKRGNRFYEGKPIDPDRVEREFDKVINYVNTNVVKVSRVSEDVLNVRRPKKVIKLWIQEKDPIDDPIHPIDPNNPKNPKDPRLADTSLSIRRASESNVNVNNSIPLSRLLTYSHIGIKMDGGSIPSGYTIRRFYWNVIQAFDESIELKAYDRDNKNLLYEHYVDLSVQNIADLPMDHKYNNENSIIYELTGGSSVTGSVRVTFLLEKVVEVQ
jgi:hypothetical protein